MFQLFSIAKPRIGNCMGKAHAYPCLPPPLPNGPNLPLLLPTPHSSLSDAKYCLACLQITATDSAHQNLQEFSKHDEQPSKYIKTYTGHNPKTGQDFSCDVAYERFLGPELFFNPEIYSSDYTMPLPQVCPSCLVKSKHTCKQQVCQSCTP